MRQAAFTKACIHLGLTRSEIRRGEEVAVPDCALMGQCEQAVKVCFGDAPSLTTCPEFSEQGVVTPRNACVHLGQPTGKTVGCGTCRGNVQLKTFGCALHSECTLGKNHGALRGCMDCPDYKRQRPSLAVPRVLPDGLAILLTGGIGDVFAVESFMPIETRERLETIYYTCPHAAEIEELWRRLPSYLRLKTHVVIPSGKTVHYSKATVEKEYGAIAAEDWSTLARFHACKQYVGSSFVHPQPDTSDPYVIICPASTWGRWDGRSFDAADWGAAIDFIDTHKIKGVVLGPGEVPRHPRLICKGLPPIRKSLDIVNAACGYLGIDTAWSVLAAKLFSCVAVKAVAAATHLRQWQHVYYAPRMRFDFINTQLEPPETLHLPRSAPRSAPTERLAVEREIASGRPARRR